MSDASISPAVNLEYYRKQAKTLLRSVQTADDMALARVRRHLPRLADGSEFKLSDAQWVLAREQGFASWALLKRHVEAKQQAAEAAIAEIEERSVKDDLEAVYVPSMKSEAVAAKTGKAWEEWFALIDAAGGRNMAHKEIVAIAKEHGAGSWWQQMVTVEYEKARGLRVKNQSCDGDHQVSVSKTINAPAEAVFYAWADPEKRALWLPGAQLSVRKATCPKSLRITVEGGGSLDVMIYPKGDAKCSCTADNKKLSGPDAVEPTRTYWASALGRLKEFVEA